MARRRVETLEREPQFDAADSLGRLNAGGWLGEFPTTPRYPFPKLKRMLLESSEAVLSMLQLLARLVWLGDLAALPTEEDDILVIRSFGDTAPMLLVEASFLENILMNGLACWPGLT